jgi:hypothetical protein
MAKTIWCLLSIENEYNQPQNNLEAWWPKHPTLVELSTAIGTSYSVADLWSGHIVRYGNTDYRLREVKEGVVK